MVLARVLWIASLASGWQEPRFEEQVIDAEVGIGYGVTIADVDGDGKPDVLLVDRDRVSWYAAPDWARRDLCGALTERDHVCIAATDLDGDGRAEVVVGGEWNPGDTEHSGSLHLLRRDAAADAAVALEHEPVVHRMRWIHDATGAPRLVVLPLHGRGNVGGKGAGVRILEYAPAEPLSSPNWRTTLLDDSLHETHNLDPVQWDDDLEEELLVCAREGVFLFDRARGDAQEHDASSGAATGWSRTTLVGGEGSDFPGASEVRLGRLASGRALATIEAFHGNRLVLYEEPPAQSSPPSIAPKNWKRTVLCEDLRQGHALVFADFLGVGSDQIAVGWRELDDAGQIGVRLYQPPQDGKEPWRMHPFPSDTACEDLRAADLDGDGDLDLVAAGRATHDLCIYWNRR